MSTISGKRALELVLDGHIPPFPPHWELVFQLEREFFGLDLDGAREADRPAMQIEIFRRLVDEFGWAAVGAGYDVAAISRVKRALGDQALTVAYEGSGVFWMPTGGNIMDFVIRLYEQRRELHAEARRKCEQAKRFFTDAVDAGADFFVLAYDFGFNDGPFISPDDFRDLVAPYLTELVQAIHELGKKVLLHSDGSLTQILDQLHATGLDGYQSVDPQGHMDIREVRTRYPDWILMGNVPCNLLQDADEPRIREAVRYCMTHGGFGRRYIFSTSNCIFKGMPPDSYRIMLDEYRKLIM